MKFKIRSKQLKITVVKGQEIEIHTRTNSQGTSRFDSIRNIPLRQDKRRNFFTYLQQHGNALKHR